MTGELLKAEKVLRIGQRIEFYVEDGEEKYLSRIEDMKDGKLIAAMPLDKKHVPVIPMRGAKIYALAVGDRCRYRFFTTFAEKGRIDGNIPVWYVVMPQEVEKHQNRAFFRVRLEKKMSLRRIDEEGNIGEPIMTVTGDISGNGISFTLPDPLDVDEEIDLEVYDIPGVGMIKTMARVIHCEKTELPHDKEIYHIGASLKNLPRNTTNKLVKYLFTEQRTNILKGIDV